MEVEVGEGVSSPPPVSSDPLREALEALIDIWDDGKHHPDNRAYVSGSFAAMIEEARATLTTIPSATEPEDEPHYKAPPAKIVGRYVLEGSSRATEPDRNAARYLWLRENWFTMAAKYPGRVEFSLGHERWAPIPESDLDAAIDAAIATRTTTPRATEPDLTCGHHVSLAINSAETGLFLYCDLCDAKSGQRDAEAMEFELSEKLRVLSSRATEPDRNAAPEGWKLLKDTTQDERSWPEDYVDENGQYFNTCHNCLRVFLGYKRRGTCKVCATRTATKD